MKNVGNDTLYNDYRSRSTVIKRYVEFARIYDFFFLQIEFQNRMGVIAMTQREIIYNVCL